MSKGHNRTSSAESMILHGLELLSILPADEQYNSGGGGLMNGVPASVLSFDCSDDDYVSSDDEYVYSDDETSLQDYQDHGLDDSDVDVAMKEEIEVGLQGNITFSATSEPSMRSIRSMSGDTNGYSNDSFEKFIQKAKKRRVSKASNKENEEYAQIQHSDRFARGRHLVVCGSNSQPSCLKESMKANLVWNM